MKLAGKPAEITLKSGKKKPTRMMYIEAGLNPLFRVFIPQRDNDKSVPKFVRTFDFKTSGGKDLPKGVKDSQGREIRRL